MKKDTQFVPHLITGDVSCPGLQCNVTGECIDTGAGYEVDSSRDSCILLCQSTPECQWWSFSPTTEICFLFQGCGEIGVDTCPECVSGQKDCPVDQMPNSGIL